MSEARVSGHRRTAPASPAARSLPVASARLLLVALLAAASGPLSPPLAAQEEAIPADRTFTGTAQVTAVDLVIDVRDAAGRVPADLGPEDFRVFEDGEERRVVAVETFFRGGAGIGRLAERAAPAPSEIEDPAWSWNLVVYVDQTLSSSPSIRRATQALSARAGDLTRLGTVQVVAADPHPRVVLPATRSARLVEQTLLRLSRELPGRDAVHRIRKRFSDEIRLDRETSGTGVGGSRVIPQRHVSIDRRPHVWETVVQEARLLREQQDRLVAWTSGFLEDGPRALLLVNDGYDLDPRDFYLVGVEDLGTREQINAMLQGHSPLEQFHQLVRGMAAQGWVCLNLALGGASSASIYYGAENSGIAFNGDLAGRSVQGQGSGLSTEVFYRPLDGLKNLARETGGELVTAEGKIPEAVGRLAQRVRLTYQVERAPDGKVHEVEVRAVRPGLEVNAPRWAGSPAPEAVASARARRLLEGGVESGDLPVTAAVGLEPDHALLTGRRRGALQARVDLSGFPPGSLPAATNLRVTFAVELPEQLPFVRHDVVEGQRLDGLAAWTYTVPVSLPPEAARVSVLVEDLATGSWGGTLASRVEGPLPELPEGRHVARAGAGGGAGRRAGATAEEQGYDLPVDLLPDPKVLVLIPPPGEMVTGGARFETLLTRPGVERVEFLLDGRPAVTDRQAPFAAKLELGDLPRPRTVEAVAYDAAGEELGRDSAVVNEGAGSFRVRLIEPRTSGLTGPVDVEAEVRVPPDRELVQVDVTWNDERVATLYAPPFRQKVHVPPDAPVGYIGVTARLADGSTAEDVVFMNGPGGDERVEVRLVELFTVVTDPTGRPIRGLTAGDFQVTEDGRAQSLASVADGSELPLSLGLLLDSSASMAEELQRVQIAALDFLFLTLGEGDRAFFVDFDSEPRLVQPLTGDLREVGRRVVRSRADGYTALCDALVYSLVQMQTVRGRRALVVFSDGAGREERVGYGTCLRVAQQVGVPIYAVVLDRDGGESRRAARVEEVARAVGGRVFYVDGVEGLGSVYREIRAELESQYLLAYYPATAADDDDFRTVRVQVHHPGLDARTVSGYWP